MRYKLVSLLVLSPIFFLGVATGFSSYCLSEALNEWWIDKFVIYVYSGMIATFIIGTILYGYYLCVSSPTEKKEG